MMNGRDQGCLTVLNLENTVCQRLIIVNHIEASLAVSIPASKALPE